MVWNSIRLGGIPGLLAIVDGTVFLLCAWVPVTVAEEGGAYAGARYPDYCSGYTRGGVVEILGECRPEGRLRAARHEELRGRRRELAQRDLEPLVQRQWPVTREVSPGDPREVLEGACHGPGGCREAQ
jgi:hypothetical protein